MGYRGVDKLSEASGVFDQLLVEDDIENLRREKIWGLKAPYP